MSKVLLIILITHADASVPLVPFSFFIFGHERDARANQGGAAVLVEGVQVTG